MQMNLQNIKNPEYALHIVEKEIKQRKLKMWKNIEEMLDLLEQRRYIQYSMGKND